MKTRACVTIKNTNSSLDGREGYLLGTSSIGVMTFWIVKLDGDSYFNEDSEEWLAVTMPECCLEVIGNG